MREPSTTAQLRLADAVPLATALAARVADRVGARVLFIKGPVASLQGLRPPHASLDVDVLVDPAATERFIHGLRALGWHDRPGYRPLPLSGGHATTLIHDEWPCDYDVHHYWPGFALPADQVFDTLWARRSITTVAGHSVVAPSRVDGLLVLALHALRGARTPSELRAYRELVDTAERSFDESERELLHDAAVELGATDTAAPFLRELGFVPATSPDSDEAMMWRIRSEFSSGAADWLIELRRAPWYRRPKVLVEAVFPSPRRLRMLHPEAGKGRGALIATWWRRFRAGVAALPEARRATAALGTDRRSGGSKRP